VLCAFLEATNRGEQANPLSLLDALGKAKTNWYGWLKKGGFIEWWNQAVGEFFSGHGLSEVHASVFRNALGNSPADRKLFMERFDKEYKPVSKYEVGAYTGERPPDIDPEELTRSLEARRKDVLARLAKEQKENPQCSQE